MQQEGSISDFRRSISEIDLDTEDEEQASIQAQQISLPLSSRTSSINSSQIIASSQPKSFSKSQLNRTSLSLDAPFRRGSLFVEIPQHIPLKPLPTKELLLNLKPKTLYSNMSLLSLAGENSGEDLVEDEDHVTSYLDSRTSIVSLASQSSTVGLNEPTQVLLGRRESLLSQTSVAEQIKSDPNQSYINHRRRSLFVQSSVVQTMNQPAASPAVASQITPNFPLVQNDLQANIFSGMNRARRKSILIIPETGQRLVCDYESAHDTNGLTHGTISFSPIDQHRDSISGSQSGMDSSPKKMQKGKRHSLRPSDIGSIVELPDLVESFEPELAEIDEPVDGAFEERESECGSRDNKARGKKTQEDFAGEVSKIIAGRKDVRKQNIVSRIEKQNAESRKVVVVKIVPSIWAISTLPASTHVFYDTAPQKVSKGVSSIPFRSKVKRFDEEKIALISTHIIKEGKKKFVPWISEMERKLGRKGYPDLANLAKWNEAEGSIMAIQRRKIFAK